MNLKNYIPTLLFTLIFSVSCISQPPKQTYTSKYALDFNIAADSTVMYQWTTSRAYNYSSLTATLPQGNRLLLTNLYLIEDYKGVDKSLNFLEVVLRQCILLPIHQETKGKISFTSMGGSIDSTSYLTVKGISRDEKIIFSKNIKFYHKELASIDPKYMQERITVSADIPLVDVELLNLNINVRGEKEKDAAIIFCKLDVYVGNQHIDEFPIRELPPIPKDLVAQAIAINLDSNTGFDSIKELKSSKIIGLGESIHGSCIVNNFAYNLIMQQVEKQNCKLVILEKHFEKILPYNRYVLDEKFMFEKEYSEYVVDLELMGFLEFLKRYNSDKSLKDKVRIFGMDYNSDLSAHSSLSDIFDYVTWLNNMIKTEELDQFALLLISQDCKGAISFLSKNKHKMEKHFPFGEYESIVHILNLSRNMGFDMVERIIKRDSVMFVNSNFLINRFSPKGTKVVVYGHSLHISPFSRLGTPFGSFMKEEYSHDYSPLSILVGEGYNMAVQSFYTEPPIFTKKRLSTPPISSIEHFLNSLGKDLIYLPLVPDFDRLVLSRERGSNHLFYDFYPFNLYQSYDGVFFIKNIETAREHQKDVPLNDLNKKYDDKALKRQKISEEIKKRLNKNK